MREDNKFGIIKLWCFLLGLGLVFAGLGLDIDNKRLNYIEQKLAKPPPTIEKTVIVKYITPKEAKGIKSFERELYIDKQLTDRHMKQKRGLPPVNGLRGEL